MSDNFTFADGVDISNPDGIHQCHKIDGDCILANISVENLLPVLESFCKTLTPPLFFFIELPSNIDDEKEKDVLHKDVFYLDNCTTEVISAILKRYGELLINDGISQFGFASHENDEEIYVMKYKVVRIYSKNIKTHSEMLSALDIPKKPEIKTVWETFSQEFPGSCVCVEFDGETVYDMVDNLKEAGLYFSHQAEDN